MFLLRSAVVLRMKSLSQELGQGRNFFIYAAALFLIGALLNWK